jgi:large subunit ribosomal protein L12
MEYIYAAMLLHKAGRKIDEASIKKVLEAAGVKVDDGKIRALVAALSELDLEKVIKEAAVMPVASTQQEQKVEIKKEEKKEEVSEEKAAAGLSALFG